MDLLAFEFALVVKYRLFSLRTCLSNLSGARINCPCFQSLVALEASGQVHFRLGFLSLLVLITLLLRLSDLVSLERVLRFGEVEGRDPRILSFHFNLI